MTTGPQNFDPPPPKKKTSRKSTYVPLMLRQNGKCSTMKETKDLYNKKSQINYHSLSSHFLPLKNTSVREENPKACLI